jgi:cell division protein FtsQ
MDGQRRIDQSMTRVNGRVQSAGFLDFGQSKPARIAARVSAVLFLGMTILHSIILGGYLSYEGSPWLKIPGKLSSLVGWAADDIRVTGLVHQEPEMLLTALGIRPGGSLIGFDTANAKALLENLDWVSTATVQRSFPNQLEISVVERVPFAVWQRAGSYYVIDRSGSAMSNVAPGKLPALPLVTGEGAQFEVAELVNQLEVSPDLSSNMSGAARVGQRRWNLYLDNGITILLPEKNVTEALARLAALESSQHLLSKGVKSVDLRFSGRVIVGIAEIEETKSEKSKLKLSQNE